MSGKRRILKMIDNPLPDQIMQEKENYYLSEQYYEHCKDKAIEICKEFNVDESFYDLFTEWYTDLCLESDEGYCLVNDKSLIEEWWEANKDVYEDPSPYQDYEPTDDEMKSRFGTNGMMDYKFIF